MTLAHEIEVFDSLYQKLQCSKAMSSSELLGTVLRQFARVISLVIEARQLNNNSSPDISTKQSIVSMLENIKCESDDNLIRSPGEYVAELSSRLTAIQFLAYSSDQQQQKKITAIISQIHAVLAQYECELESDVDDLVSQHSPAVIS